MNSIIVNPRFSFEEVEKIDLLINSKKAKNRADFVRIATLEKLWSGKYENK